MPVAILLAFISIASQTKPKNLTLDFNLGSLGEFVAAARKQGVNLRCDSYSEDLKISVFCNKVPAEKIISSVASVYDLKLAGNQNDGYTLLRDLNKILPLALVLKRERQALQVQATRRIRALAGLLNSSGSRATTSSTALPDDQRLTPEEWAAKRIKQEPYEVFADALARYGTAAQAPFFGALFSLPFLVDFPPIKLLQGRPCCLPGDPNALEEKYLGKLFQFHYIPQTGFIQAAQEKVEHAEPELEKYDLLAPILSDDELKKSELAKSLEQWSQPIKAGELPVAGDDNGGKVEAPTPYVDDTRITISDELRIVATKTGIPMVLEGSRFAELPNEKLEDQDPVAWLNAYVKAQQGYARVQNGIFEYRPRSFWRARMFETPQPALAYLESAAAEGAAGLEQYANFTGMLNSEFHGFDYQWLAYLQSDDYLVRFKKRPLRSGMPALLSLSFLRTTQYGYLSQATTWIDTSTPALETFGVNTNPNAAMGDTPISMGPTWLRSLATFFGAVSDPLVRICSLNTGFITDESFLRELDTGEITKIEAITRNQKISGTLVGFSEPLQSMRAPSGRQYWGGKVYIWIGFEPNAKTKYVMDFN